MMNLEVLHDILIAGSDFESCRQQVARFFNRTMLIRYDEVLISEDEALNGTQPDFWPQLESGLTANRKILQDFLGHLKAEGFSTLDDLEGMEKGYQSKMLHIVAHLQDGFIGIDSRFYNLAEDSHGISGNLRRKIAASPENYWLLRVKGKIASTEEDPLDALRTFEGRTKLTG